MLTTALQRQPGHCALPWQHHLPWHQPSRHPAALSPSLAGLQLPAKMPLGTCHSCEDCLPLKLAPAQKTQAFPEVSVTGNTKHRSSFPTEEQDIFPQSWAITMPALAIPASRIEGGNRQFSQGYHCPDLLPLHFSGTAKLVALGTCSRDS